MSSGRSRVEQVPGPLAEPQEFLSLCALGLGAVAAGTERTSSSRGGGAVAEGRASTLFVLGARSSLAGASVVLGHGNSSAGRRRGRWLVASVVDYLG
jgi:hypothetical protein